MVWIGTGRKPKLLDKGDFVVDRRFFSYVTEDAEEQRELSKTYEHIVFANRQNILTMSAVKATQQLHLVGGEIGSRTKCYPVETR